MHDVNHIGGSVTTFSKGAMDKNMLNVAFSRVIRSVSSLLCDIDSCASTSGAERNQHLKLKPSNVGTCRFVDSIVRATFKIDHIRAPGHVCS